MHFPNFLRIVALVVLFHVSAAAQQAPRLVALKAAVADSTSEYYYPKVLQRYLDGDTTLTLADGRVLYFGFPFRPGGSLPSIFDLLKYEDELQAFRGKRKLSQPESNRLLVLCDSVLKTNPFSLEFLRFRAYAAERVQDTALSHRAARQAALVTHAILSTGSGHKPESAIWVMYAGDEYEILRVLKLQPSGQQALTADHLDCVGLQSNKYELSALYFNVSISFGATGEADNASKAPSVLKQPSERTGPVLRPLVPIPPPAALDSILK